MKYSSFVCALAVIALLSAGVAFANPYASQLKAPAKTGVGNDVTISYFLNQEAGSVEVNIYNNTPALVRTLDVTEAVASARPGTATGANSVVWDTADESGTDLPAGAYTYEIVAADTIGFATWTQLSGDEPHNTTYSPRGVDINKNPASPYFGRVYIANRTAGTSTNPGGFPMFKGVYMYNPDLTFAEGTTNGYADGNAAWASVWSAYLYALEVGDDDNVYVGDWGSTDPTLVQGDPEFNSAFGLLNYSQGSKCQYIMALDVEGTGANRVLYTIDDTYDLNSADWLYGNWHVWMYEVGNASSVYTGDAIKIIDNGPEIYVAPMITCQSLDVVGDMVYAGDRRASGGPIAYAFDVSSSKLTDGTPYNLIWSGQPSDATYSYAAIGDINAEETLLCYGMASGKVGILDVVDGAVVDAFQHPVDNSASSQIRGAAWDPAGNIVTVSAYNEWIRLWSPPGTNSYTTPGPAPITIETVTGLENNHWSVFQ